MTDRPFYLYVGNVHQARLWAWHNNIDPKFVHATSGGPRVLRGVRHVTKIVDQFIPANSPRERALAQECIEQARMIQSLEKENTDG